MQTRTPELIAIDKTRLLGTLNRLAAVGADPAGGITRPGFSVAERAARDLLTRQCRADGLVVRTDAACNLIVQRADADPSRPALLMGSHLDTVVNGGRLDGAYGVAAAVEVVRTLNTHPVTPTYEPVAVAFANEEGADFPCPFFGSKALAGRLGPEDVGPDREGRPLHEQIRRAGGDLDRVREAAWAPGSIAGFLELHIEQGPILEAGDVPIGVVEAITGRVIFDVEVRGQQNHAGTTPMAMRCDALVTAARIVLMIRDVAEPAGVCRVATVGVLDVAPNTTNVVPGGVRLTAEIRDGDPGRLRRAEQAVRAAVHRACDQTGSTAEVRVVARIAPVATDHRLRNVVLESTETLRLEHLEMPSGAGHDAQIIAGAAPIGMIFVPSRGGVSHAPSEATADEHLVAGANVLLRAAQVAVA